MLVLYVIPLLPLFSLIRSILSPYAHRLCFST